MERDAEPWPWPWPWVGWFQALSKLSRSTVDQTSPALMSVPVARSLLMAQMGQCQRSLPSPKVVLWSCWPLLGAYHITLQARDAAEGKAKCCVRQIIPEGSNLRSVLE